MVFKLLKNTFFCNFLLTSVKKPKSLKAIYIYGSESSHDTLSENGMVYRCLRHCLLDISD